MDVLVNYIGWLQGESSVGSKKRESNTINYNVMAVFSFYNYLARFHAKILETKLDFYTNSDASIVSWTLLV